MLAAGLAIGRAARHGRRGGGGGEVGARRGGGNRNRKSEAGARVLLPVPSSRAPDRTDWYGSERESESESERARGT